MKGIILLFFLAFCSVVSATTYYVAPNGDDSDPGSEAEPWLTWNKAISTADAGDTVFFRGGVYYPTVVQMCNPPGDGNSGTKTNPIHYFNYPNETPILDGINKTSPSGGMYFFNADNIHIKGLTVRNNFQLVADFDDVAGIYFYNYNNITIENCISYNSGRRGFYLNEVETALIVNCDSYNNCDNLSTGYEGGAGDGFLVWDNGGADDTTSYVVLRNCRAWHNSDDGFDLQTEGYIEADGCWSFNNGYLDGDGMGFKYGLKDVEATILTKRITNCISAYNMASGFNPNDRNRVTNNMHLFNNTSYHNGYHVGATNNAYGYIIYNTTGTDAQELNRIFKNNIAYDNEDGAVGAATTSLYTSEYNSWNTPPGVTITDADFISVDSTGISGPRQADGSLPDLYFLKLSPTSSLIDAGTTNAGLPYSGEAPDLGAWEYIQPGSNMNPSVVITSPVNNSKFAQPATIYITANAFDVDGTISKVEFFNGATKLGEITSNPWSFTWNNVPAGTYSLTAVATDNSDAKTTSSAVSITVGTSIPFTNQPPVITISNPVTGSTFTVPVTIAITANASDTDGTISKVEFFNGAVKLDEKTSSPWSFVWNNVPPGTYSLTAVATDNFNAKTISSAVSVTVNNLLPVTNQPPVVSIVNPSKGKKYIKYANITMDAVASDPDGTISKVEFFNGDIKLIEMTAPPYSFTWKDVDEGTYFLMAVATDNLGVITTSSPVDVVVVKSEAYYNIISGIINLYPNPNNGIFTISYIDPLQSEWSEITINSLEGKTIYKGTMLREELTKQFDLSYIKPGFYILVLSRNEIIVTKKFIKE